MPADIIKEATGLGGAVVTYTATATDANPVSPAVTCAPISGSTFALGQTTVNCSATDTAGNTATGSFKITVQDTTAPVINLSGSASINLHIGDSYTELGATATDIVDGTDSVIIGGDTVSTTAPHVFHITYDATDNSGNHATQVIRAVNVSDITAPVINPISDVSVEATGPSGAAATYGIVTATDDVDGSMTANCSPASGSIFPIGSTPVSCTATDSSGNIGNGTGLTVVVTDTTPPVITLLGVTPVNLSTGAPYTDAGATALDNVNGDITASIVVGGDIIDTSLAGTYTTTYNVTDAAGNHATQVTRIIIVTDKDTTPPVITAPADQTFEATGALTTPTLVAATATDIVDPDPVITYNPSSFPVGDTTVTWTATDASGNSSTATSKVTITKSLQSIIITTPATKLSYIVGNSPDITGLVVTGTYDDTSTQVETITASNVTGFDSSAPVTGEVLTITVDGRATTYTIDVVAAPVIPSGGGGGGGGGGAYIPPESILTISDITSPSITTDSLTLTWTTNLPSSSYVIYSADGENHVLDMTDTTGTPPKYGYAHATPEIDTTPEVTLHTVTVTGLNPLTTYYFRTVSRGSLAISGEYTITTPAVAGAQTVTQTAAPGQGAANNPTSQIQQVQGTTPVNQATNTTGTTGTENAQVTPNQSNQTSNNPNPFAASLLSVASKYFWPLLIILIILIVGYIIYLFIIKRRKKHE